MKKNVIAIVQARMGSSRLPGKTLVPIFDNKPVLELMLERVSKATMIDQVIVATSTEAQDDALEQFCQRIGYPCFRGNENDVLDRFYQAALSFDGDILVRLTGDCPLHDPAVLDQVVKFFIEENLEYGSNVDPPTFPDGLDTEVFTFEALKRSWEQANQQEEREHVTIYIKRHPELFKQKGFLNQTDLSSHHWTLDNEDDLNFVKHIYNVFYHKKTDFHMNDILEYLNENPDVQSKTNGWTHMIR